MLEILGEEPFQDCIVGQGVGPAVDGEDGRVRNLVSVGEMGYFAKILISWRLTHGCTDEEEF